MVSEQAGAPLAHGHHGTVHVVHLISHTWHVSRDALTWSRELCLLLTRFFDLNDYGEIGQGFHGI